MHSSSSLAVFIQNISLSSKKILGEWSQSKTTTHLRSLLPHFLFSFSSYHTRRSYLNDLKDFFSFLSGAGFFIETIDQIKEEHVELWKQHLSSCESNLMKTTISHKLHVLSSLFEFAKKRHLIAENPLEFIQKPRPPRQGKSSVLTPQEVSSILTHLKNLAETCALTKRHRRHMYYTHYVLMVTLFSVGMRVQELCSLKVGDVLLDGKPRLHIANAKGQTSYTPFLHRQTSDLLRFYLQEFRQGCPSTSPLFARAHYSSSGLTPKAVFNLMVAAALKVGITKKVSPHSCRATLATRLHRSRVPIVQIQKMLNHKSIETTSLYVRLADEKEESAARKINILK